MTKRWLDCDYNVTYSDVDVSLCTKTEDENGCDECKKEKCTETIICGELDTQN